MNVGGTPSVSIWFCAIDCLHGDLQKGSRPSCRDLKPGPFDHEAGLPTKQLEQLIHKDGFVTHQAVHFVDQLNIRCKSPRPQSQ
jgi:hypothetical protein